jgi:hypothetical protein
MTASLMSHKNAPSSTAQTFMFGLPTVSYCRNVVSRTVHSFGKASRSFGKALAISFASDGTTRLT